MRFDVYNSVSEATQTHHELYGTLTENTVIRDYADTLDELSEQAIFAEEAGYDCFWIDEHHFNYIQQYINLPNPSPVTAMLAAHTSRIRIGQWCILPFWQPLRLAEDVALLDHITRGRLELGVGRGGERYQIASLNPNPVLNDIFPDQSRTEHSGPAVSNDSEAELRRAQAASREHFSEFLDVMKKSWTGELFAHEGTFFKFPRPGFTTAHPYAQDPNALKDGEIDGEIVKMRVGPASFQKPHPPLSLAISSDPSFEEAGRQGLKGMTWVRPPGKLRQGLQLYADARTEREGRQFGIGEDMSLLRFVYVAPTYEEAKRDADPYFTRFYHQQLRKRGLKMWVDEGEKGPTDAEVNWEFFRKQLLILAGSPEQVAEQIQELDELCTPSRIVVFSEAGGLPHKNIMSSLDLFASKVAPLFADRN